MSMNSTVACLTLFAPTGNGETLNPLRKVACTRKLRPQALLRRSPAHGAQDAQNDELKSRSAHGWLWWE